MSLKQFAKELGGKRVEGELIKSIFYILVISFLIFGLLYFLRLRNIENFLPKYGFYIFFAILSYSIIIPSIRQVRAYRQFSCMSGMMIGMTSGMIAGFLPGFLVGATNGIFWGGIFGVFVGIAMGIWNGRCCGIMGIMEGLMAGFMGGLMGAMTSVMMINDNIRAATVIVFIICATILISLNYMIYKEKKDMEREHIEDYGIIWLSGLILTALTIWMMVLGPRGILFT